MPSNIEVVTVMVTGFLLPAPDPVVVHEKSLAMASPCNRAGATGDCVTCPFLTRRGTC